MEKNEKKRIVIIGLIIAVVAGSLGYFASLEVKGEGGLAGTIHIGFIECDPADFDLGEPGAIMAIDDMNEMLERSGNPVRFDYISACGDGVTPVKTLELFQSQVAADIQVVVGVSFSSHCILCLEKANQYNVPIISPFATSTALTIKNDSLFRIIPNVGYFGKFISKYAEAKGFEAACITYAAEPFGEAYYESVKAGFTEKGIEILEEVGMDPESPEWMAEFGAINTAYVNGINTYGDGKVLLVNCVSTPKGIACLDAMSRYPALTTAPSIMSPSPSPDWTAQYPELCESTGVISFAMTTPETSRYVDFVNRFNAKFPEYGMMTGEVLQTYDGMALACLSVLAAGEYNGEKITAAIPEVAKQYFGVTGYCELNEYGDRGFAKYTFLHVVPPATWEKFATYDGSTDELTFY